jgi:hypothetical protein
MTRNDAMKRYNLLKSRHHLKEFIDYEPTYLRSLSDKDLVYLVTFLDGFYNENQPSRRRDSQIFASEQVEETLPDPAYYEHPEVPETAYILELVPIK